MNDILNDIAELVYITDIHNYDLLYINASGKEHFHIDSMEGVKCYKALQGRDDPCPFCMIEQLSYDSVYTWKHWNPVSSKYYLLKDCLVEWNQKPAHLEIAFDISEQMKEQELVEKSLHNQQFLMQCVQKLYNTNSLQEAVQQLIQPINEFLSADATIFVDSEHHQTIQAHKAKAVTYEGFIQACRTFDTKSWQTLCRDEEFCIIEQLGDYPQHEICQAAIHNQIEHMVIGVLVKQDQMNCFMIAINPDITTFRAVQSTIQTLHYFMMLSIKRWNAVKQLENASYQDVLTGLYNRNRFMYDTSRIEHKSTSLGIIYLDVNGLKDINDKQGHQKGDDALIACADMLMKQFASYQNVHIYRMGGDEFALLWTHVSEKTFICEIRELCNVLACSTAFKAALGYVWSATCKQIEHLISEADFKMYEDKKCYYRNHNTSNRYRHYNDEILELVKPEILLERIRGDSFVVYVQPKFSFADKSLIGAEALIRYVTPDGEVLPPMHFLPLLEDYKLIGNIDFYVFEIICAKLAQWQQEGRQMVPISTNFSRYSIMERDFVEHLDHIVEQYHIAKDMLEVEITETVEGIAGFDIIERVSKLRNAGYTISVDDFGSQYANLSLFTSIAFNVLKIDKGLVDNIVSSERVRSVVAAVVGICRSMNVQVIVEGVETQAQFETLKAMGCEGIQGFLFSRPLPLLDFEKKYMQSASL